MKKSPTFKLDLGRYDYAAYAAFAVYAASSLVIPISLVAMGQDLNFPMDKGGMGLAGILHLTRSVAMVAALLGCGFVAGKYGKRYPMGISVLLMGIGIFFCAFVPSYWFLQPLLLIARLGEGTCEGLATPFVEAMHTEAPERYVNISHSFWSVGIGVCVLAGGALLSCGVSWRYILAGTGVLAILTTLLFLWKEKPAKKYPEEKVVSNPGDVWRYTVDIAKQPRFWLYCAGMFMGAGAEFCLTFWAATFLQLSFNATAWMAGLGTAAIALGMFFGRNFFGFIARENNLPIILISASLGTIPLTLSLSLIRAEYFSSAGWMFAALLFILFLCGIGIAPYWPTLQVYGVKRLPKQDTTMLYIYFSAIGIPGCGFFTWLIGFLGDHFGLKGAFYMIPVTLLLYASIILFDRILVAKEKRSDQKKL